MAKVIRYLPELQGDEQVHVARIMKELTEEQAEQFAHVYRMRRKDPTVTLALTVLGFFVIAGVHRFYLGQIGMGLLYLFTFGLCFIGTIVDVINHKKLPARYNMKMADEVAALIRGAIPAASESTRPTE